MSNFVHNATEFTPEVCLSLDSLTLKITGTSKPINALSFYSKILQWLDENNDSFSQNLTCDFHFDYINTSSQKMLYDIFKKLENIHRHYNSIKVIWRCSEENEDIKEIGEDIFRLIDFPFDIVLIPETVVNV